MLKKILIGVAVVAALLLIAVATRPDTYHVERSAMMTAPADLIAPEIADLHRFATWSPWDKLDPNMKKTFDGPAAGVGSSYAWEGNDQVGKGKMTVVEAAPAKIVYKLEFLEPFPSTSKVTLSLDAKEGGTNVTWAMDGDNNFVSKFFSLFMNMDSMIGPDFEKGLAGLKVITEDSAKKAAEAAAAAAAAAAQAQAAATPAPAPAAPAKKK